MKLFYGWIIVGAGIVVTCIGLGAMLSLSVFLQPIQPGPIELTYCFTGYDPDHPEVFERECGAITGRSVREEARLRPSQAS